MSCVHADASLLFFVWGGGGRGNSNMIRRSRQSHNAETTHYCLQVGSYADECTVGRRTADSRAPRAPMPCKLDPCDGASAPPSELRAEPASGLRASPRSLASTSPPSPLLPLMPRLLPLASASETSRSRRWPTRRCSASPTSSEADGTRAQSRRRIGGGDGGLTNRRRDHPPASGLHGDLATPSERIAAFRRSRANGRLCDIGVRTT